MLRPSDMAIVAGRPSFIEDDDMPKLTERDRLAELVERQRKATEDLDKARRDLRGKYAEQLRDLAVERLSERELKDVVAQAIRAGGPVAIAALKALPDAKV